MSNSTQCTPLSCLLPDSDEPIALVVLNRPITNMENIIKTLWKKAVVTALVDGAANMMHQANNGYVPTFVSGDFDSASPEVLEYYREKGAEIIPTPDQNFTDFTKCLKLIGERIKKNNLKVKRIVTLGEMDGRFDHVMANIESLFLMEQVMTLPIHLMGLTSVTILFQQVSFVVALCECDGRFDMILANVNSLVWGLRLVAAVPVYLLSSSSFCTVLCKGRHEIRKNTGLEDSWCGLIPIGGPCENVSTTGLKWNLKNQRLKFGELVSTSNTYDGSGVVTIETDSPLVWSMGVKKLPT